jgi:lycopene cyclase domain-containing protein
VFWDVASSVQIFQDIQITMQKFLYLFIDIISVVIPIVFTFHPRLNFQKNIKAFLVGLLVMLPPFILWDICFARMGVWGFNPDYLLSCYFFSLPLEECLFFVCIPYSCVFTYHVVYTLSKNKKDFNLKWIWLVISVFFLCIGLAYIDRLYTSITFISLSVVLLFAHYLINFKVFLKSFIILLFPFLIVNGLLTGAFIEDQVVWYNNSENLSIRLGTIPVEDVFHALLMLVLVMLGYQFVLNKKESKT